MNLENLDDDALEAELKRRKELKQQRLEFLNAAWDDCVVWMQAEEEAYKDNIERDMVYVISATGITTTYAGEKICIRLSFGEDHRAYEAEVKYVFRGARTRLNDYNNGLDLFDVDEWLSIEEKLKQTNLFKANRLVIDESVAKVLSTVTREAAYTISKSHSNYYIECGKKGKSYEIRSIPGCTPDTSYIRWRYPLTEAWRILNLMNSLEAKDGVTVAWQGDAKTFAEAQLERRLSLDLIAQKKESDVKIEMNGHKFHEYQNLSVEFAEAQGNKLLIAHEMGLGKTPIGIALAERMVDRGEGNTILLITPASLIPNWQRQLIKFVNLTAYRFTGEIPEKFDMAMAIAHTYRYYIINYDILSTSIVIPEQTEIKENGDKIIIPSHKKYPWVEVINTLLRPDMIIADEFHYIQNVSSNRSTAVRDLIAPRFIGLSGTPFTSYVPQLWPGLSILDKEAAGPYETFVKYYTLDGKNARSIDELRAMMQPLMFRKTKAQVLPELAPIERINQYHELSPEARRKYTKVLDEGLMDAIDSWDGDSGDSKAITCILAQLMALKQICAYDKAEYIADLATRLHDESEKDHNKVIIFTQFVDTPPLIAEIAKRLGNEAVSFSGHQTPEERLRIVDRFQKDPNVNFLVCSTKAASEGLDITAAGHVIFADLMWTPASHHQAEARAYGRMSDLHSISSYYVLADNTLESELIMPLLESKLNTFNSVIEGAELSRQNYSIAMEIIQALKNGRKKLR